jgi:Domain of unknown function (DUF5655)
MATVRDWQRNRQMWIRILEKQTGEGLEAWNRRLARQRLRDKTSLRAWLSQHGVKGYAQSLLVMEQFGYPDFVLATADQLIQQQYADRPQLLPIYKAIIKATEAVGEVTIQARKTFVSLLTPRRTFARVQPTTKTRVDLGLRLDNVKPAGRLQSSKIHETMRYQISLTAADEVDSEVSDWLRKAYAENS